MVVDLPQRVTTASRSAEHGCTEYTAPAGFGRRTQGRAKGARLWMKTEPQGKRDATSRRRKQRSESARRAARTKVNKNRREEIIFFRVSCGRLVSCHKKAYDHAPKARVHPASPSVVVAIALPFGSSTIPLA